MAASQREEIIRAAMKGVRLYGLEGVRIRYIAQLADSSVGNIYQHFSSKEQLMKVCFERVDRQIARLFDPVNLDLTAMAAGPEQEIYRLWSMYFRWLVAHPDETVFYHRFRDSVAFPAFDKQRDISYFSAFIGIVDCFEQRFHIFDQVSRDVLWLYVLTSTVMYAKYTVEGVLPDTPATEKSVFNLMMFGLRGLMGTERQQ